MTRFAICLLACLMSATIVSSRKMLPSTVHHPDRQCMDRGYLGACIDAITLEISVNCNNIECAQAKRGVESNYRAMSAGRALDGTHCGRRKVCYSGECIQLPAGSSMPRQRFEKDEAYICFRPNGNPSATG